MPIGYETVIRLTNPDLPIPQRRIYLREFARTNGWRPSDELDEYPGTKGIATGHLVVEHGLDNSAVISFLQTENSFVGLERTYQNQLLAISYNNMVDWHIFPERNGATFVYNRIDPIFFRQISLSDEPDSWTAEAFDRVIQRKPNPNLKALDDALMDTISFWKRALSLELKSDIPNDSIAALFNAIIFVRALEDHHFHKTGQRATPLIDRWISMPRRNNRADTFTDAIGICLSELEVQEFPAELIERNKLKLFHKLDPETLSRLLQDFYTNKYAPIYNYDFSLMSKHALSRIYEHYVSLLRTKDSPQLKFFPDLPDEEKNKSTGSVYTPQYIARFFARYLKENLTPKIFRQLSTCDPACGSGIFLRTLLEMQCDPLQETNPSDVAESCFNKILGIDVDPNACQASKLSLSLLHLVLTGRLPKKLQIVNQEAIELYLSKPQLRESLDVLIGNPPFIKWDLMTPEMKSRVADFMKLYSAGKVDMFLAVLKVAMGLLKPDGMLLFVLPHSFLLANNAKQMRLEILEHFWIRFIGDISDVRVFGETGAYVILLILQKKNAQVSTPIPTTVLQCRDFVGHALQNVVEGKLLQNDYYSIFLADQSAFTPSGWSLIKPEQSILKEKLSRFPALDSFLDVQEGFVSGADTVFIRKAGDIDKVEKDIYVPYLSDREMERFTVPKRTSQVVFHPFVHGVKLTENRIREDYPETWAHLKRNIAKLKQRSSVKAGSVDWWCPHRPMPVLKMLTPKLISPHLILIPRFSFDESGRYAVSRCPWLTSKNAGMEMDFLRYFVAVLNSTAASWQIVQTSHKYSRGYAMLEKKTLKQVFVPNPKNVEPAVMKKIIQLVEKRMQSTDGTEMEHELDEIVANLYGLSSEDREVLGIEK